MAHQGNTFESPPAVSCLAGTPNGPRTCLSSNSPLLRALLWGIGVGAALSLLIVSCASLLQAGAFLFIRRGPSSGESGRGASTATLRLEHCARDLQKRLDRRTPSTPYFIVSSSDNTFVLMKGKTVLRRGICSTGSFIMLKAPDDSQTWVFKTPRGMFQVLQKLRDPVWRMPDWAFVEEGERVPPSDSPERFEHGALGKYALILGEGYMIHGTLYQRFLGMPVTHGCVRLGDDDLEVVYRALSIGSKVFMY